MPGAPPSSFYQGYNPSPAGVPEVDSPHNERLNLHANPEEFGAGIGQAEEHAGRQIGQVAEEASQLALKYQGMLNETYATNAETQFIQKAGEQDAKFKSLEGLAAIHAAPQHIADLTSMQQQLRQTLPGGAARSFDQLTTRQLAYRINEANSYVAQQIKAADLNSAKGQIATSVATAGDMGVATNDEAFNHILQDIHFGQGRMMQNQGWDSSTGMQQNENGEHTFNETPEGSQAKDVYSQMTNANVSKAWENRLKALAENGNILDAYQKYKDNYDQIPSAGHVAMDQYFAPKIRDAQSRGISEHVLGQQTSKYNAMVYGGQPASADTAKSAIDWTMQHEGGFVANDSGKGPSKFGINQEANPDVDVTNLTQDQAAKIMHDKYWVGVGADKMSAPMAAVAFDTAVNMGVGKANKLVEQANGDPQKLIDLRRAEYDRLAESNPEKYGKNLAGWNARLDDLEKTIPANIATRGKIVPSIADQYKAHYSDILENARNMAEQSHPGDIDFAEKSEARTKQRMDAVIQQEKLAVEAQQNVVLKALDGSMSNGQKPQTLEQLIGISPDVKNAWTSLEMNNPKAAEVIEKKMVGAKPGKDMGSGFSYLQQEVLNGKLDVNDLLYHVGDDLTQSGFDKLHGSVKNKTPDEMDENSQMAKFLKNGHEQILHSSLFHNTPEAENAYQQWFSSVDKSIKEGQEKKIPMASMLDKNSKDYVGKDIQRFSIPVQKQLEDRAARINGRLQGAEPVSQDKKRLPDETPEAYLARVK